MNGERKDAKEAVERQMRKNHALIKDYMHGAKLNSREEMAVLRMNALEDGTVAIIAGMLDKVYHKGYMDGIETVARFVMTAINDKSNESPVTKNKMKGFYNVTE